MTYFVGWDVGGWNCDKNPKSRDAIVILDSSLNVVGEPWRGNLRRTINDANDSAAWVGALFNLCRAAYTKEAVVIGIDTPLGLPAALLGLATKHLAAAKLGESCDNPYLFRETERYLFDRGKAPLSAIKDMIGSQATKGMHVLARFAREVVQCGVWSDGDKLFAIEVYPASCKSSPTICDLRSRYPNLGHQDEEDALTCALIAYLFSAKREQVVPPTASAPKVEGWIWVPRDALDNA